MASPSLLARRQAVQTLRGHAQQYDVERVPDKASRTKVVAMAEAILEVASLTPEHKVEVEAALAAHKASYVTGAAENVGEEEPEAPVEDDVPPKKWSFRAVQLTYNKTDGDWAASSPAVLHALFERLCAFARELVVLLSAIGVSVTLERSTAANQHVHAHIYLHSKKAYRRQGDDALAPFTFEEIHPHVNPNKSSGRDWEGAVRFGHFYVFADKIGTVESWSTYEPWKSYAVEGWWLDNLLKQNKLTRDIYLIYAARVNIGFQSRLLNVRAAERHERIAAVQAHVEVEAAKIASITKPCKEFPVATKFISLFDGRPAHRRPILVIVGGTNLGKSVLAADILRKVGKKLNIHDFLEITVEGQTELDLATYDHRRHAGILLDGVGDALFLQKHRETLQGRPKIAMGGQSATNVYAYPFTLANRAVIATFDLSAENLRELQTHHWLSDERNVLQLNLKEQAWIDVAPNASSSSSRKRPAECL